MVVPLAARYIAAFAGLLIVLTAARSIIGTVIVPRPVSSWLIRRVDQFWAIAFRLVTARITDFRTRDRILASQVAAVLLTQIIVWLLMFFVGYALLLWPFLHLGITAAFTTAGPALWEIGSAAAHGAPAHIILDIAALCGVITVTLQISYLPTLYAAFNRRETDVALLNARAGVPSWGPELLARTHYALGSGVSSIGTLPQLFYDWERWAADVTESHTTYLPLVRFRSQKPLSSWVTSLLAVLDSAALFLALSPEQAPTVPARLCLRSGFLCFNSIAQAMGFDMPEEPDPESGTSLTYGEFLDAIARMRKVDFPMERQPEEAWPDFVGWRLTYERAAYAIAGAIDAVPALWSGPRRIPDPQIPPYRPPSGRTNAGSPVGGPATDGPPADGPPAGSPAAGSPAAGTSTGSGSGSSAGHASAPGRDADSSTII
jgi:hypothetical protein